MTMQVHFARSSDEWERCYPVMKQLRPQYDLASFCEQIAVQVQEGYQLAYVEMNGQVIAVAGFVIATKLAWGKHLYVDDLVTDDNKRSTGAGKCLLDALIEFAKSQDCQELHLDSGVQRFEAHRFYLREGMHITSHHFQLRLKDEVRRG
ncbi:GNAT family N-acetyltransferase [Paraneptunicella aestuarii]|uniref:GNAT family N-acetyltransferase n=1 Tax=Paraneptunicella aestuarii TaxID=2831148 RepID=UPI001E3374AA|nr:GNAT family N-acetyltransferase [Paraneptunicella aestuarii]